MTEERADYRVPGDGRKQTLLGTWQLSWFVSHVKLVDTFTLDRVTFSREQALELARQIMEQYGGPHHQQSGEGRSG